jgi:nitroreductase
MELYDAMRSTPAMRVFKPDPVAVDVLRRVLDHARFAPSGGNRQPWSVVAIQDQATRTRMRELYVPNWENYLDAQGATPLLALDEPPEGLPPMRLRMIKRADHFARHLDDVPLHMIVCARLDGLAVVDAGLERPSIVGGASIYPFVQNLLLGLRNEGVGASLTTLITPSEPQVRELLALPDEVGIAALVAAGYPAEPWPTKLSRKPVEEFAFGERWGEPL